MTYDILIKNGTVIDGTDKPGFKADIGINADKIFEVGNLTKATGKKEIDAAGQVVTPGFIDVQNHSDSYGSLLHSTHLESLVRQGITTALLGQCGSSLAPLMKGSLASIQKWTEVDGININWNSLAEFLENLNQKGLSINLATLVGHATLRRDFVGDSTRPLSAKEETQIGILLKRSLQEGAQGLSIGLAYSHERLASEEEIHKLLKIAWAEKGVVSFHLRNEGPDIFAAINEVFGFLRNTPIKSKISHLKIMGQKNPADIERLLRMLEVAVRDGVPLMFDIYPFTASAVVLYLLLPEWATLGGKIQLLKRLKDKTDRINILNDMATQNYPYEKITIASAALGHGFIGKSLAQIARDQNTSAPEAILNLLTATRDQIIVFWHDLNEDILKELIAHPLAMIATDGSGYNLTDRFKNQVPHPRSFGTTAELLGKYVREKKILNLEKAVYKLTGLPASWLNLENRGVLAKNKYADVVVFDAQTITNNSSYNNPFKYPTGISHVLVNGHIVVKNGNYEPRLSGRVLKK